MLLLLLLPMRCLCLQRRSVVRPNLLGETFDRCKRVAMHTLVRTLSWSWWESDCMDARGGARGGGSFSDSKVLVVNTKTI